MEKIASFQVDHLRLLPGLYVSRRDRVGDETITTFDLRMTAPNREAPMGTAEMHALEHLGATYLRNHPAWKSRVLYWGPMGCRTGFYLLLSGALEPADVLDLLGELFAFAEGFAGDIPGASARDCGNFADMDLNGAIARAKRYREEVLASPTSERTAYPT